MNANSEVVLTHDGADRLKEELVTLKTHRRKEIADRIKQARGYGDLKENSEYDEAKNEQAFVEGRIATLEKMLKKAIVVEDEQINTNSVGVGSVVRVLDVDFDEEVEYTIVGSAEADVFKNKISNESPVGSSLMGRKVNEIVEVNAPGGMLEFKILAIHK